MPVCAIACFSCIAGFRDSAAVWVEQTVNAPAYIGVVQAVSHEIVWAVGDDSHVYVTTNGGVIWVTRTVPGAGNLSALFAFDDQVAVVADQLGRFWRTTDQGTQWIPVHPSTGSSINGIHFFDDQNGWAMGDPVNGHYVILLSADGGWTWTPAPNTPPGTSFGTVRSYDWIGTQIGLFSTRNWVLWRTTNAGAEWDSVGLDYRITNGCELSNTGIGLASGHNGQGVYYLRRSTDFGVTWLPAVHPPQATQMRYYDWIEGTDEVWASTNQTGIFQSTNAGIDWVRYMAEPTGQFAAADLDFVDHDTGWCVGGLTPGRVFRWTTTAGISLLPTTPATTGVIAYPNPFRSELIVEIATPNRNPAEWTVYDAAGHAIWSGFMPEGMRRSRWDGRDLTGRSVASGAYFYKVQAGDQEITGRIVKLP
jgi:photosystem II stability/assembly factor-like uncharacterized protein